MIDSAKDLNRLVDPKELSENVNIKTFENTLRPKTLDDYIGQANLKRNLRIAIDSAKKRKDVLDHVLLHGSPGLGKTTLASIISYELSANLKITSGPALERQGDLASIISNLEENDVLFIDEIHRLRPQVEEVLYTAMEDFAIDIVIGKGASARTMRIDLPKFTLIGATTKFSSLSSPLRDRFVNVLTFNRYELEDIRDIILRSASILGLSITEDAAFLLSKSARFTPRVANRLLKRVRDFAVYRNSEVLSLELLDEALTALGIDSHGLDARDREILKTISENFSGGPVGLNTIAAATNEEEATIEDVYEPYLIQKGFLERTPRGRKITRKAEDYIKTF